MHTISAANELAREHGADRLAPLDRLLRHLMVDRAVVVEARERVDIRATERLDPGPHDFLGPHGLLRCSTR
jgi:hypothetical protein